MDGARCGGWSGLAYLIGGGIEGVCIFERMEDGKRTGSGNTGGGDRKLGDMIGYEKG